MRTYARHRHTEENPVIATLELRYFHGLQHAKSVRVTVTIAYGIPNLASCHDTAAPHSQIRSSLGLLHGYAYFHTDLTCHLVATRSVSEQCTMYYQRDISI